MMNYVATLPYRRITTSLIGLLIFGLTLYGYVSTLAPTVLEGDAALFQYTSHVLGVTYPTGFPSYILLGKLWLWLFPFGDIAWRMNLLSALCSALAMTLLYDALRRLLSLPGQNRANLAALLAVLTFATLPTFWRWSTEAKTYAVNILLLSSILWVASFKYRQDVSHPKSLFITYNLPFAIPFLLGLAISVHNTILLLAPGIGLLWLWFTRPHLRLKTGVISAALFILPNLAYLYIPIRAEMLIAEMGRTPAIEHGLLADFYRPGWDGLRQYFTAADFTQGVTSDWGEVPNRFLPVYVNNLLVDEVTELGIVLAVVGGLLLMFSKPRLFAALFLIYATPIPFVLAYNRGQQSAFLLPSFLMVAIAIGYTAQGFRLLGRLFVFTKERRSSMSGETANILIQERHLSDSQYPTPSQPPPARSRRAQSSTSQGNVVKLGEKASPPPAPPKGKGATKSPQWGDLGGLASANLPLHRRLSTVEPWLTSLYLLILIPALIWPQAAYNINWLTNKWDDSFYRAWDDALQHPLPDGAGLVAHWADLTSFWYLQHVEQRRPDLRGLYPPDEARVSQALRDGDQDGLFIAGDLQDWAEGIQARYQLIPWGRLVRIAPPERDPRTLLPDLNQSVDRIFADQLHLLAAEFPVEAIGGTDYGVTLTWQALADLPPETTLSLRLTDGEGLIAQADDTLLSGWFPTQQVRAGQHLLTYLPIPIVRGTLVGTYRLQLVVYAHHSQPWSMMDGQTVLDLGEVSLRSPLSEPDWLTAQDFAGELALVEHSYSVSRVGQGKGFAVRMLWLARQQPTEDYQLVVELVDRRGQAIRQFLHQPTGGKLPTSQWQTGQWVRDQVDLVVPASASVGEDALTVRLSWQKPDGGKLTARRWLIPLGDTLDLPALNVTEKKDRTFERPMMDYTVETNFADKLRLLGFSSQTDTPDRTAIQLPIGSSQLELELYWQGISEMPELYTVFLHLVDGDGQIVSQMDKVPGIRGKQPTTGWLPNEVIADPITLPLPPDLPAAEYTLRAGMYLPQTGQRLLVLDAQGVPIADFVDFGRVLVR